MNAEQILIYVDKDKERIVHNDMLVKHLASLTLKCSVNEPIVTTIWETRGAYPVTEQKVTSESLPEYYPLVIHVSDEADRTRVVLDGKPLSRLTSVYVYLSATAKKILRLEFYEAPTKKIQEELLSLGAELIVRGEEGEMNNADV